jgi:SAM-dependent methyltransferase
MNIYLRQVMDSVQSIGVGRTLEHIWGTLQDSTFDWKYGTETASWMKLDDLDIASRNKTRGIDYHPTRTKPFKKLFRLLNLPKEAGFVDFGCGKGRSLIIAMELGFSRAVGVEFSPALCEIARRNIDVYRNRKGIDTDTAVIESDVVDYKITPADRIFYFFNPFDEVVLSTVLRNIKRSLQEAPRKIWVVYYNPVHRRVIDEQDDMFVHKCEMTINGCPFLVYKNKRLMRPGAAHSSPEKAGGRKTDRIPVEQAS